MMQLQIFRRTTLQFPSLKEINGVEYPVVVQYAEGRTATVKVRGGSIIFRIPRRASRAEAERLFNNLMKRIERSIMDGSAMQKPFEVHDGQALKAFGRGFRIVILEKAFSKRKVQARLHNGDIVLISVASSIPDSEKAILASAATRKLISQAMLPTVTKRIMDINNQHYNFAFSGASISRINMTRWGSCSPSRGRINLDFRLLFAPDDIMDSVIIHELCHLKVSRHNRRFWELVYKAMPDYKEKRKWLNKNGNMLGQAYLQSPATDTLPPNRN